MSLLFKHRIWILLALAVVMAATRMSHFGTSAGGNSGSPIMNGRGCCHTNPIN